jgi:hypothetical protein
MREKIKMINGSISSIICIMTMLFAMVILTVVQSTPALGVVYTIDYTNSSTSSIGLSPVTRASQANSIASVAYFELRTLQYDPFPVNPGEWFDLWIKVQNTGNEDSINTTFQLVQEYPFSLASSVSSTKDYGIIPGVASAFKSKQAGDTTMQANQVILKYRVKVADNAPEGDATITIKAMTGNQKGDWFPFYLPISIAKTKTDFDVVTQDSTTQGTSFAIANTGQNTATAVIVSMLPNPSITISGASSSILGNLAAGDYTTVSFQISQNNRTIIGNRTGNMNPDNEGKVQQNNPSMAPNQAMMQISYTDNAGIRNTINKTLQLNVGQKTAASQLNGRTQSSGLTNYIYIGIGIVIGALLVFIYRKLRKKKQ